MQRKAPAGPVAVPRLSRAQGLRLEARHALDGLYAGSHRTAWHGASLDFSEHRAYQPGDDPRSIDWRAFARSDRLLIRRWHDDRQLPLALLLDTSDSLDYGEPSKRSRCRLAAAIIGMLACDQGDSVRVCPGVEPWHGPFSGPGADGRVCQAVTEARTAAFDAAAAIDTALAMLPRRSLLVVVGDLLADPEPLIAAAAHCAGRGHALAVVQVLDPTELALPAQWGEVLLTDPEDRIAEVACDAAAAKSAYDAAIAAHVERLRQGLSACRAGYLLLRTDQDPAAALAAWIMRRLAA